MENNFKQKLSDLVYNSKLTDDQKLLWKVFLKEAKPEETEAVYEAASESADCLELLTDHLHSKIKEMLAGRKKET